MCIERTNLQGLFYIVCFVHIFFVSLLLTILCFNRFGQASQCLDPPPPGARQIDLVRPQIDDPLSPRQDILRESILEYSKLEPLN